MQSMAFGNTQTTYAMWDHDVEYFCSPVVTVGRQIRQDRRRRRDNCQVYHHRGMDLQAAQLAPTSCTKSLICTVSDTFQITDNGRLSELHASADQHHLPMHGDILCHQNILVRWW